MGICSFICKEKQLQIIDPLDGRISTKDLNGNKDTDRISLKTYFDSKCKQMLPIIREVYLKAMKEKPTTISIINDKIVSRQSKFLSIALRYYGNLEVLNLRGNGLGNIGAELISKSFIYVTHLTQLTIEDNQIKSQGFKEIFNNLHNLTGLRILSLNHNTLGDSVDNLISVLRFLDNLKELYLDVMEITSGDFNSLSLQLSDCKKLKVLGLGYNRLDSGCMVALCFLLNSLPILEDLILSGIEIPEHELDRLITSHLNINIKV